VNRPGGSGSNGGSGAAGADIASRLPANAVIVEVGISNANYVEILSGLEEGMLVVIPASNATAGMNDQFGMSGFGVGGGGGMMVRSSGGGGAGAAPAPMAR
jgi:HlyD family secretion protein